jgi:hypothetical protein
MAAKLQAPLTSPSVPRASLGAAAAAAAVRARRPVLAALDGVAAAQAQWRAYAADGLRVATDLVNAHTRQAYVGVHGRAAS